MAIPAAAQFLPIPAPGIDKPALPAKGPTEAEKAAAELAVKQIMALQDYGLPPGLYFQNAADLNGGVANGLGGLRDLAGKRPGGLGGLVEVGHALPQGLGGRAIQAGGREDWCRE